METIFDNIHLESPLNKYCYNLDKKMLGKNIFDYYSLVETIDSKYLTNLLLEDYKYRFNSQLNILAEIYGQQGCGKSLFGQDMASRIASIYEVPFDMKNNTVADFDILDSVLHNTPYRTTFIVDEQPLSMFGYGSNRVMRGLKDYEEICRYCILGNTEIYIIENDKLKIKKATELNGKTFTVLSKNLKTGRIEYDNAFCKFDSIDYITKITLTNGKTIEGNDEHPFFIKTKNGLQKKRIEDLEVGDDLFCKKGIFKAEKLKHSIKTKKKLSKIFKEKWKKGDFKNRKKLSKKLKKKMNIVLQNNLKKSKKNGNYHKARWTKKHRKQFSDFIKKKWKENKIIWAKHISKSHKGFKWTKKRNQHITWLWKQDWYIKKQMKARNVYPNKLEIKLNELLQINFPKEYSYVGNGKFILAGKNPDFINCNGQKKIIELFGEPFHSDLEAKQRIKLFKKFGFKTLIIWSAELSCKNKLIERIRCFNED